MSFKITAKIDIMLTDSECEKPLADGIESVGGLVVSSEYIIQVGIKHIGNASTHKIL
jgi:hypothetical protein